ncbi:hypothetical protein ARMSODRAFT_1022450 [Armillaria solidipes]|uniref:Uncharacterized protein n=1 Tax=Armillaria solidipes TaxID=1076256 RepID=A0A2H3B3A0_9AGAR|nr:hypothetical protein ARMSODRAFT_1022450 [Armillaria solidipes]
MLAFSPFRLVNTIKIRIPLALNRMQGIEPRDAGVLAFLPYPTLEERPLLCRLSTWTRLGGKNVDASSTNAVMDKRIQSHRLNGQRYGLSGLTRNRVDGVGTRGFYFVTDFLVVNNPTILCNTDIPVGTEKQKLQRSQGPLHFLCFFETGGRPKLSVRLSKAYPVHERFHAIWGTEPSQHYGDGLEESQSDYTCIHGKPSFALQAFAISYSLGKAYCFCASTLRVSARFYIALYSTSLLPQTTMPALNVFLKVAEIAEASGVPYLENVAKVAVVIFELLEQKGKNKENAKELCESIANTIVVIDALVRMQGERGAPYFMGICGEMEGYLQGMAQDLKDTKHKYRRLKGVFNVDEFRDAIQAYRKRVDDLKTDFLIHVTGDCLLEVMQMHCLLKDVMTQVVTNFAPHTGEPHRVYWPWTLIKRTATDIVKPAID